MELHSGNIFYRKNFHEMRNSVLPYICRKILRAKTVIGSQRPEVDALLKGAHDDEELTKLMKLSLSYYSSKARPPGASSARPPLDVS